MSRELKLSSFFFYSTFALLIYRTSLETSIIAVAALLLVALVIYVERLRDNQAKHFDQKIKELNDRINGMELARGLGR